MKAKKLSQSDIGTMKRLLPFIGRRWIALLASLILAAGSVLLQLYVPSSATPSTPSLPPGGWTTPPCGAISGRS